MRSEMVDPQGTILREIADLCTRDDAALTYAFCLRQSFETDSEKVDFKAINRAIVERWSLAGLEYVKTKAWKVYEGKA